MARELAIESGRAPVAVARVRRLAARAGFRHSELLVAITVDGVLVGLTARHVG